MVGGEAPSGSRTEGLEEVVFHLLRFESGEFDFHSDDLPSHPVGPFEVEEGLIQAEQSLVEWRDIETVVPTMDGWLTLEPELGDVERTVKLSAADWQMVAAIGGGTRVIDLAEALEVTDLAMCRAVKALVERELVAVGDPVGGEADEPVDITESDVVDPSEEAELAEELAELEEE